MADITNKSPQGIIDWVKTPGSSPATGVNVDTVDGKHVKEIVQSLGLNDLSDVTITTPENQQVLTFTGTGWTNKKLP